MHAIERVTTDDDADRTVADLAVRGMARARELGSTAKMARAYLAALDAAGASRTVRERIAGLDALGRCRPRVAIGVAGAGRIELGLHNLGRSACPVRLRFGASSDDAPTHDALLDPGRSLALHVEVARAGALHLDLGDGRGDPVVQPIYCRVRRAGRTQDLLRPGIEP